MPPPKIICFWGQPCHTNLSKMQEMLFCQCHQCSPRGKQANKKNQKTKRERQKFGDYTKHAPSQLSVRHGKELLVIAHLVYPPASAGMFSTIYLLQLSTLDWKVWKTESSTSRFGRLVHSPTGATGRVIHLIFSFIYIHWISSLHSQAASHFLLKQNPFHTFLDNYIHLGKH